MTSVVTVYYLVSNYCISLCSRAVADHSGLLVQVTVCDYEYDDYFIPDGCKNWIALLPKRPRRIAFLLYLVEKVRPWCCIDDRTFVLIDIRADLIMLRWLIQPELCSNFMDRTPVCKW